MQNCLQTSLEIKKFRERRTPKIDRFQKSHQNGYRQAIAENERL